MDMGCGKSKTIIDTAAYLFLANKIDAQVIVAPKGCYNNWVDAEMPAHMSDAVKWEAARWTSYQRKADKEAMARLYLPGRYLRTFVFNVEAASSERGLEELAAFLQKYRCMMTVDESTTIKSPTAKRTVAMINLGKLAHYRRICSGNPTPNSPLDVFSQSEFLKKNLMGYSNFFAFRNRFAVLKKQKFGKGRAFQTVVGYRDLTLLKELMSRFSFIIKKADCLDLPPKIYQTIDCEMGPKQKEAYNQMRDACLVDLGAQGRVFATIVITQLVKLHQIACGYMKTEAGHEIAFDEPNDRLAQLLDILDGATGKVIIWAIYRYNIRQISAAIAEKFGQGSVVTFFGENSGEERTDAKARFQGLPARKDPRTGEMLPEVHHDPGTRFMVANQAAGKFGNTWTRGTTMVYYANDYNLENRDQSEDRPHRIGQTESVLIIDLRVRGTVDEKIVRALRVKKKLTDELVVSNWHWLVGDRV
jgi:hypothetical protein